MEEFLLKKNLKRNGWFYATLTVSGEDDEQKEEICNCLLFLDQVETIINSIYLNGTKDQNERFWNFIERFLNKKYVGKISITFETSRVLLDNFMKFKFLCTSTIFDIITQKTTTSMYKKYTYENPFKDSMIIKELMEYEDAVKRTPSGYHIMNVDEAEYLIRTHSFVEDRIKKEHGAKCEDLLIILPNMGMFYSQLSTYKCYDGIASDIWVSGKTKCYNTVSRHYIEIKASQCSKLTNCPETAKLLPLYLKNK